MSKRFAANEARLRIQKLLETEKQEIASEPEQNMPLNPDRLANQPANQPAQQQFQGQPIREALHGPNPVDNDSNGNELWEIESIRDFRRTRTGAIEYLIRWKSAPGQKAELSWEDAANIQTREAISNFYHWRNSKRAIQRMKAEAKHAHARFAARFRGIQGNSENEELPEF